VAADLLAQAEHDPMASAILITTSHSVGKSVWLEIGAQIEELERKDIVSASLANNGLIIVVPSVEIAIELANAYAPEHLCLLVNDPWPHLSDIKHAGGVFVGESSPEALADYAAGPSHVMPTGGSARFFSTLHLADFTKVISLAAANDRAMGRLGRATIRLAEAEGLTAHARAIKARLAKRPDLSTS
jgi:histidinol dehydrogenase